MPTQCQLCNVTEADSEHHLFPSDNNKPKAMLCGPCHDTIHRNFTNKELTKSLNTIEALSLNPKIEAWLVWRRKHPKVDVKVKTSNTRKKRGRYA